MKKTMHKMQCFLAALLVGAFGAFAQEAVTDGTENAAQENTINNEDSEGVEDGESEVPLDKARAIAQEEASEEGIQSEETAQGAQDAEDNATAAAAETASGDDEPYLSDADEDAILDGRADKIMEGEIAQERKADTAAASEKTEEKQYIVRVEVYARPHTPYIPMGDLSLEEGFFFWSHDGRNKNGYAVLMYPACSDESAINIKGKGAYCIYAQSFESVEAASQEIQGPNTKFSSYITYKPVVNAMLEKLQHAPYQEEVEHETGNEAPAVSPDEGNTPAAGEAGEADNEDGTDADNATSDEGSESAGDEGDNSEGADAAEGMGEGADGDVGSGEGEGEPIDSGIGDDGGNE